MIDKILNNYKNKMEATKKEKENVWKDISNKINPKKFRFHIGVKAAGLFFSIFIILIVAVVIYRNPKLVDHNKTDDWQYDRSTSIFDSMKNNAAPMSATAEIGLSAGGAKDINNFRKNIEEDYLPLPSSITYEGVFYDYYFDTAKTTECSKLFCPSYVLATSNDPFSNQEQYYMAVGLNSNLTENDFARKKLNLVVVLDISGSMGSAFSDYYYDQFGNKQTIEQSNDATKMEIANESIVGLLDHLTSEDRFGMVLFDEEAYLAKPLSLVGETDMEKIKAHILTIQPQSSTNMEAGMAKATDLLAEYKNNDQSEYENRIIFLTDAMPNTGDTTEEGFLNQAQTNADSKIYTTFIGIGVDFNTDLIDSITKIKGANYYSVHSSEEFKTRMDDEFDYMVTPLVFNLTMNLESQGFEIEKVYGSPEANEATGEIMKVNTLFPSKTEAGATKGGVILIQLAKKSEDPHIKLAVSYEDREGKTDSDTQEFDFTSNGIEYFENSGVRKAILLARYVNLMKDWINDERQAMYIEKPVTPVVSETSGIVVPELIELGPWEQQSVSLTVSSVYKSIFSEFLSHFQSEMSSIGDTTLEKEAAILEKLVNY